MDYLTKARWRHRKADARSPMMMGKRHRWVSQRSSAAGWPTLRAGFISVMLGIGLLCAESGVEPAPIDPHNAEVGARKAEQERMQAVDTIAKLYVDFHAQRKAIEQEATQKYLAEREKSLATVIALIEKHHFDIRATRGPGVEVGGVLADLLQDRLTIDLPKPEADSHLVTGWNLIISDQTLVRRYADELAQADDFFRDVMVLAIAVRQADSATQGWDGIADGFRRLAQVAQPLYGPRPEGDALNQQIRNIETSLAEILKIAITPIYVPDNAGPYANRVAESLTTSLVALGAEGPSVFQQGSAALENILSNLTPKQEKPDAIRP
jgi:hypothetical protein